MSDLIANLLDDLEKDETPSGKITPQEVYSKTVLTNEISAKLLEYQRSHVARIISILLEHKICLNASDPGIGKTYMSIAVCKELHRRPLIVCPKSIMSIWVSVCEYFDIDAYDIVNYETIRNAKTYTDYNFSKRKKPSYLRINKNEEVDKKEDICRMYYIWRNIPDDILLIVDEAHRCNNPSTDNGRWLISTKQLIRKNIPVMLLSGTISEKTCNMKIPFYLFGLIPSVKLYNSYIKSMDHLYKKYKVHKKNFKNDEEYLRAKENARSMIIFHEVQKFTCRIKVSELGDRFPANQWSAQQFIADDPDKIEKAYEEISKCMKELRENPGRNTLAKIQKLKQEIELRKIPIFIEQAQLMIDNGRSVIIFVNYLKTLDILSSTLNIKCKVYGDQTFEERKEAIELFQSNKERIIILQARAGSVGISLHDIHGDHPRFVLINYPDSAADLLQELGRAARAGAKTPVCQRIILVANVEYERRIMININKKLSNISGINDGDLNVYNYQVNKVEKHK